MAILTILPLESLVFPTMLNIDLFKHYQIIKLNMRVNGSEVKLFAKEKANKFGLTDLCMKAGGNQTKPTAEVDLSMLMETFS